MRRIGYIAVREFLGTVLTRGFIVSAEEQAEEKAAEKRERRQKAGARVLRPRPSASAPCHLSA
jgi:hypothetical protein